MMNSGKYLTAELDEHSSVLTLTLNRQDNPKNSLNTGMILALLEVLSAELIQPRARALILRSAQEKVFSIGADIEGELKDLDSIQAARFSRIGGEAFTMFTRLPCISIALLSGFALGGGLELALCCDFRIATQSVRLGLPEINLGVIPGWGGTQRLQRLIGRSRALRMILSGDPLNAAAALDCGLVDQVVESPADLDPAAAKLIGKFAGKSRTAIALAKRAVYEGGALPLNQALMLESEIFGLAWSSEDRREGISAYLEKRKPVWPD